MLDTKHFLIINYNFDRKLLQESLCAVLPYDWIKHPNTQAYEGEWKATSLRSTDGTNTQILAVENKPYLDTPLLEKLPYIQTVIDTFKTKIEAVRFMKLGAHSVIKEHRDFGSTYEDGLARIHIPVTSNDKVEFTIAGEVFKMEAGKCYYIDADQPHSVVNYGDEERVHILIDCHVNDWVKNLFKENGFEEEVYKYVSKSINDENVDAVIQNLKLLKTDVSMDMALELETKRLNSE